MTREKTAQNVQWETWHFGGWRGVTTSPSKIHRVGGGSREEGFVWTLCGKDVDLHRDDDILRANARGHNMSGKSYIADVLDASDNPVDCGSCLRIIKGATDKLT